MADILSTYTGARLIAPTFKLNHVEITSSNTEVKRFYHGMIEQDDTLPGDLLMIHTRPDAKESTLKQGAQ